MSDWETISPQRRSGDGWEDIGPAAPVSVVEQIKSNFGSVADYYKNAATGAVRGAARIGTTLLRPLDATGITGTTNQERVAALDAFSRENANPDSLAFKGADIGTQIAGTGGVGGLFAKGAQAVGAAPKVVSALQSGGFSLGGPAATTLPGMVGNAALRTGAGAVTGGAMAGLVDPSQAQTGAMIGAALPGLAKAAGMAGSAFSGSGVNQTLARTLGDSQGVGYVVPPSMAGSGVGSRVLEGISGKYKTNQLAGIRNQEVTNSLARKALGLTDDTQLTFETLGKVREAASEPYRQVASLPPPTSPYSTLKGLEAQLAEKTKSYQSALQDAGKLSTDYAKMEGLSQKFIPVPGMPRISGKYSHQADRIPEITGAYGDFLVVAKQRKAEADFLKRQIDSLKSEIANTAPASKYAFNSPAKNLERLKEARSEANTYFSHYNRSADPKSLAKAKSFLREADELEEALEYAAKANGDERLVAQLLEARKQIAKSYTVERALKDGSGNVDAKVLGRLYDKRKPLSDGLDKIGRFASTFGDVAAIPKSGNANPFTVLDAFTSGAGAAVSLPLMALPAARVGARYGILSHPYQRQFVSGAAPQGSMLMGVLGNPAVRALAYQSGD